VNRDDNLDLFSSCMSLFLALRLLQYIEIMFRL
jgi:hypothetical protein